MNVDAEYRFGKPNAYLTPIECESPQALGQAVATTISPLVALFCGSVVSEKQRAAPVVVAAVWACA